MSNDYSELIARLRGHLFGIEAADALTAQAREIEALRTERQLIAWVSRKDLQDLQHANGMGLWAESPHIYAPLDPMGVSAPEILVAVWLLGADAAAPTRQWDDVSGHELKAKL